MSEQTEQTDEQGPAGFLEQATRLAVSPMAEAGDSGQGAFGALGSVPGALLQPQLEFTVDMGGTDLLSGSPLSPLVPLPHVQFSVSPAGEAFGGGVDIDIGGPDGNGAEVAEEIQDKAELVEDAADAEELTDAVEGADELADVEDAEELTDAVEGADELADVQGNDGIAEDIANMGDVQDLGGGSDITSELESELQEKVQESVQFARQKALLAHQGLHTMVQLNQKKLGQSGDQPDSSNPTAFSTLPSGSIADSPGLRLSTVSSQVRHSTSQNPRRIYAHRFKTELEKMGENDE